jgi:hypothetical protein
MHEFQDHGSELIKALEEKQHYDKQRYAEETEVKNPMKYKPSSELLNMRKV